MTTQLLAIVLGTLVSEDLTAVTAGLLIQRGELTFMAAALACSAGIYIGDLALWLVGRVLGSRVLSWPRVARALPAGRLQHFAEWIDGHTGAAIFGSRLAPGTRLPLYLAAGACRSSFGRFAGWSLAAVAVWTPALVGISALAGEHVASILAGWLAAGRALTLVTAAVALIVWSATLRLLSRQGRQRLAAAISRVWRWEFWPMWLFYAPVALWTFWLALRHGGYRTITAANPGIPDGGVVGESKFDILSHLPADCAIPAGIVEPGTDQQRVGELEAMLAARAWRFPLVLKPDVGQRGTGVRIVRSIGDAAAYLVHMPARVLVQPYHPGPFEAGVFYYRHPAAAHGQILCITDKHFPALVGDGRSSIEDLIWSHERYRMQARPFLARLGAKKDDVPSDGERVALGIAGNHAQGTMFTDGRALITPALESRIDAIARGYDGFFIGRFDVRYRDREAFMGGRDLAIVELNGATAECTNIYDPSATLLAAYGQLFRQWRLVFEIGAANRRAGRPASSTERLLHLIRAHLAAPKALGVSD